ncbi:Pkinase-domain-containing protein [Lentithecium fluviatile CBS 122367]|uniref:cyclin-dependent kinase n=1 Tax=Lentithecium fluviatile CBS 122367 TaxID=1168545 RepID=A0A6G1J9C3_9PLEO|nr:Pkinase-domain-containing protein [Lentithecium fluviatile CBS 122367]
MASRWADTEADAAEALRKKKEKEEKKRLKLRKQQAEEAAAQAALEAEARPSKRRRLSSGDDEAAEAAPSKEKEAERNLLRFEAGGWAPCRHTSNFETLNHIEEGSYGWVSRARELSTGEVVALKKVKMDLKQDGFPTTALREIALLQRARHPNIVSLHEVLSGSSPDEVVLVMEFVEHDLKTLQEDMPEPFLASEVKTLLKQLVGAVSFLHSNAILHRDLKTSNILLSNRGHLKIADFGMARYIPPPNAPLTQLVVTLWYRAPELLLGAEDYGAEIDMWSFGCIFGELLSKSPILQGKNEVDELSLIFALCGLPSEKSWPGFYRLPNARSLKIPRDTGARAAGQIRAKFPFLTNAGAELLSSLLSLNPEHRPTAEEVVNHSYFKEAPKPKPMEMFPTFPSKAGQEKRRRRASPNAPKRGDGHGVQNVDFSSIFASRDDEETGGGFQLKMV